MIQLWTNSSMIFIMLDQTSIDTGKVPKHLLNAAAFIVLYTAIYIWEVSFIF